MSLNQELYKIVGELRLIAAAGLHFASNPYDRERYERVRAASAQLVAAIEQCSPAEVLAKLEGDIFDHRVSPLSTADAVVLRDDQVFLIKRHDNGLWALPGGIVEVNQTLASAALCELQQETGLCGRIIKLLGIFDSHRWDSQDKSHMHHAVFLVDGGDSKPRPTLEATAVGFFSEDNLPELAPGHHLRVPFVFKLVREEVRVPYFDPADAVAGCE